MYARKSSRNTSHRYYNGVKVYVRTYVGRCVYLLFFYFLLFICVSIVKLSGIITQFVTTDSMENLI